MPTDLVDSPVWQTLTAPVGGERRTAQSVRDPLQRAANRDAYLKAGLDAETATRSSVDTTLTTRLNIIAPGNLVRFQRSFPTAAALAATTDHPAGSSAYLDGVGWYRASGVDPELAALTGFPGYIVSADGLVAWEWEHAKIANIANGSGLVANGLLMVDASKRIPAGVPKNGLVARNHFAGDGTSQNITTSTLVDVINSVVTFTGMKAGDVMITRYEYQADVGSAANLSVAVKGSCGGSSDGTRSTTRVTQAGHPGMGVLTGFMTAPADGDMSMRLVAQNSTAPASNSLLNLSWEAKVNRP